MWSLAYSDNERAKQLLYALDDSVWGMKITVLDEFVDFATLDTEKLFTKLKSHGLSHKDRPNHDASLSSKVMITGARIGGHVANPINTTDSSALEFGLSFLSASSDELYESIGPASSAAIPLTSSPTAPSGGSSTPPSTSTATTTGTTPATRAGARRSTASETRRRRSPIR
jgi:hypothetical protein